MSIFGGIKKIGSLATKLVVKSPVGAKVAGTVLKAVPVVGTAISAYGAYQGIKSIVSPAKANTLPTPSFTGKSMIPSPSQGILGTVGSMIKGPGGKFQLPGTGPDIPAYLKQFSLDDKYLTIGYRAPRGYVVLRDPDGKPFAVNKQMARQMGMWKPGKKPLISIRDTSALRHASTAIRKLQRATHQAKAIANWKGK